MGKFGMSTAPRSGQTPSKTTVSKLSTATGSFTVGTLRQGGDGRAPDGGASADYPKGWRFLPSADEGATYESNEILKKNPRVVEAMKALHSPTYKQLFTNCHTDEQCKLVKENYDARQHQIINDAHYNLVIAPQIKAQEEQLAKQKKARELEYATLKMRVQELEKKPTAPAITLTTERSWSKYAILGIGVVIFLIILRRRA